MKILITGATGMLGYDLCKVLAERHNVVGLSRGMQKTSQLTGLEVIKSDIADRKPLMDLIVARKPDLIIHCAAVSDVDYCELNPEVAFRVNSEGTKNLADAAKNTDSHLIYVSTDYVFDGTKNSPYLEDDTPNPINVYGRSKLDGEKYVRARLKKYFVIRSSWMFGAGRRNFIDSILDSANKVKKVKAVSDKFGSPTYTLDLSKAISDLINKMAANKAASGIYHVTNAGVCSRFEIAKEILKYSNIDVEVVAIKGADAGGKALRPDVSALDNSKIKKVLGYNLRHYSEAFKAYLQNKKGDKN